MANIDFSNLLLTLIEEKGLTKKELAEKIGISRSSLYNILNGDIANVKLTTLVKLASALGVHPLYLLKPYFISRVSDINTSQKIPGLGAGFLSDVTYPDYSEVFVQQTFVKKWEVMNTGSVPWENLYLACQDETSCVKGIDVGLCPAERKVPIPYTKPGEKTVVSVTFTAPLLPCTVKSEWKTVDENGDLVLEGKYPLYCLVKVIGL